ncbi:Buzidau [Strongyloides ratti]|uniref:Buzidau n=1 Tax=Strongyloides ratti TaxID=34506 RepID=A0A090KZZ6_STRRB|nr:Buzidau [Strongyloides ratti]CEF60779.1 Buzidau [Strongyloides ratti]
MHNIILFQKSMSIELKCPNTIEFYPFAYALYNEFLQNHCWYCLNEKEKINSLSRCSGCHFGLYCNTECQRLGWKDHIYECKAIQKTNGKEIPDIEVRLLGRIVTRYKLILKKKDVKINDFYKDRTSNRNIMDIWHHKNEIKNDYHAMAKFNSIYEKLIKFYDESNLLPKEDIFELHCRDFINRHAISDKGYLNEIGKGLYLDLCAYDHSCRPNTIYVCNGFVATLRPLNSSVNLLDKSSTFYSYIDLFACKQQRKKMLKDTWYFNCECERCKDDDEHILTSMICPSCVNDPKQYKRIPIQLWGDKHKKNGKLTCPECGTIVSQESVLEALKGMRFIEDILERKEIEEMSSKKAIDFLESILTKYATILPTVNVYYIKIVQALIPLIDSDDTEKLLDLHSMAEKSLRICFPENHPAIAFHLRNIGIFYQRLGKLDKSKNYFEEALKILQFSLSDDHSMTKDVNKLFNSVNDEILRLNESNDENIKINSNINSDDDSMTIINDNFEDINIKDCNPESPIKETTVSSINDDEFPLMELINDNQFKGNRKLETQDSLTEMFNEDTLDIPNLI